MPLLIKNGRIITASDDYTADIYCAGAHITRIDRHIGASTVPDAEVIDASGLYVFPGFIDPHVHVHLPFMGTHAKDTWTTASQAALLGGTTTLIEMVCPDRSDEPRDALARWRSKAEGQAACDYSFHMGVTRFDDDIAQQLRQIAADGVTSFKVFLAYQGAFDVSDAELYGVLQLARELNVIVCAHCENATAIAARQQELIEAGRTGPEWHEPSRPTCVEAEGVNHLMTFAELTGAEVYCVHTSCAEAVAAAERGIARGVRASVEVVIPHLVLSSAVAELPEFEGAKYVMSPPLRAAPHQEALWRALQGRRIATVGTDHAPFDFDGQKTMGRDDFTRIPNGIPSVQDRIALLYTHGVARGRIDLQTFVECASTRAAKIFGLRGKGTIAVGADADLCLFDPNAKQTISASTHRMNTDYSAFEGWETVGAPRTVTVRGTVMVRDGAFVGPDAHGRQIRRRTRPAGESSCD